MDLDGPAFIMLKWALEEKKSRAMNRNAPHSAVLTTVGDQTRATELSSKRDSYVSQAMKDDDREFFFI